MKRTLGVLMLVAAMSAAGYARQATPPARTQTIVQQVRAAIASQDFARGDKLLADYRAQKGITPEWLEALSSMGRAALSANKLDEAERYARETYRLASEMLKTRPMDQEPRLPIAYGAAVEVLAQIGAARGERTESIRMLERELKAHSRTSVAKRLQKNINLLSLEGTTAPAIVATEFIGEKPPTLDALKGKAVLLFFWAHWCSDCKRMGPVLAELEKRYSDKGLILFAPTQRYGYVARGQDAPPDEEKHYIERVLEEFYPVLAGQPVPLDEANHLRYGVSSTPTLVLVDRTGIIRLYHPGQMTLEDLEPHVRALISQK